MVEGHWRTAPLGKIATLQRGFDLPQRRRVPGAVPIITSSGVGGTHCEPKIPGPGVVTGRYGTIGEVFFINEDFWPLNTTLYVSNFHGNDPLFISYLLRGIDFHTHSGKSGVPGVNRNDLHEIPVRIPPILEQRAIASALWDVDALLAKLDQLIAKKRDLKQAAMQRLLGGKSRLRGHGDRWKMMNLAESSVLKARIGWQGLTTGEYLDNGDYILVTGTDFVGGRINWASCHFVDRFRYMQDRNIQLAEGDILVTKDGTIGKVALVDSLPRPATLNSGIFVMRPKAHAYEPLFLYYVLSCRIFENFLAQLQAGSTISHLYQKDFVGFSFPTPSIREQEAIAAILSDMDAEIAALEARREKTRLLKQGMMQELLTGRIRLV